MNFKTLSSIPAIILICGQSAAAQPTSYELGSTDFTIDGSGLGETIYDRNSALDVEWASIGKINWEDFSNNSLWQQAKNGAISWPAFLIAPNGKTPDKQPHGDVLAYTMGAVGDVDGDGYGDFALTWYDAQKRIETTSVQPVQGGPPGFFSALDDDDIRVGYVRVISGHPLSSGWGHGQAPWASQMDLDTYNASLSAPFTLRRLGADFWGKSNKGLWSHEITSIGDIDGDGKSEVILSANSAGTGGGFLEVWSWSTNYYSYGASNVGAVRWVKILEITGLDDYSTPAGAGNLNVDTRHDEFGYNAYSGPIPDLDPASPGFTPPGFDLDYNGDGQPDLILSSRFYRDDAYDHMVQDAAGIGRTTAPGVAQVFLMPKKDVFLHIKEFAAQTCDVENNWTGEVGSDGITDDLPLRMTSDDYTIKVVGAQVIRENIDAGPTSAFPRYFGNAVGPAGDLDGDGIMDLAVAAANNVDQQRFDANPTQTNFPDYEGQVYFFLSRSIRTGASAREWGTVCRPKFYIPSPLPWLTPLREECGPKSFGYKIKENNFALTGQQINMTSLDADYVMIGADAVHQTNSNDGFGSSMEAGMNFDGDLDPDLAVCNSRTGQAFVFLDLQSQILNHIDPNGPSPLWGAEPYTTVLWKYDTPGNLIESDIIIRSGGALAGEVGNHFNLRSAHSNPVVNYARLGGISVAGDHDGDGDCELFVSCTNSANRVLLVIDIPNDPSTIGGSHVLAEVWSENLNYSYTVDTKFNSIHAHHDTLRGWALWNPASSPRAGDDMLVGVRGFPRLIEEFHSLGNTYEIDYSSVDLSLESNYKWLGVPAGKGYLLRSQEINP